MTIRWSLPDLISEFRQRFGLAEPESFNPSLNPLSDAALARAANEAHTYLASEAVRMTAGVFSTHNKGLFLRQCCLTVEEDGIVWLPPDIERLINVSASSSAMDRLAELEDVQLIGQDHCGGEFARAYDHLVGSASLAGQERWVVYNSNLAEKLTAGTVSSATATTMTPGATPTYSTAPLSTVPDFYNKELLWVKNSAGTVQTVRIKDYSGVFTIYGSAWPIFTPSEGDTWSIMTAFGGPGKELTLYEMAARSPWAPRGDDFKMAKAALRAKFNDSVQGIHAYDR